MSKFPKNHFSKIPEGITITSIEGQGTRIKESLFLKCKCEDGRVIFVSEQSFKRVLNDAADPTVPAHKKNPIYARMYKSFLGV